MWRLKKGLYGLAQAGRTWVEELNAHMDSEGFTATPKDPAVYVKNSWMDRDFAAASFWVDRRVALGSRNKLTALSKSLDANYGIAGLGEVRWVLSMLMERDRPARTISISQEAFIDSILVRFNLTGATTVATPLTRELTFPQDCPTLKDEIEEMPNRPCGSSCVVHTQNSPGHCVRYQFAPVLGTTPVASIGMWPNE